MMRTASSLVMLVGSAATVLAMEFHVAPGGNDANVGTVTAPFKTLERARDAARQGGADARGGTVYLHPGSYRLTATFELDERDSHTTYRSYKTGARARLTGGLEIAPEAFRPVRDPAILERLPAGARGHVFQADLRALGVAETGAYGPRGFRRPYVAAPAELFFNDDAMEIARWPNKGEPYLRLGKVVKAGGVMRQNDRYPPEKIVPYDSTDGGIFHFKEDRPLRWLQANDIWISGLFAVGFADDTVQVKKIDPEKKQLHTVHPTMYGFRSNSFTCWFALNLLEEIDVPGEYFIDRETGTLYFYPPGALADAKIQVSTLTEPMVAIEGATGVVFEDLILECTRGTGVYIERGSKNQVRGCTLRNMGILGVQMGQGIEEAAYFHEAFTGAPVSRRMGSWHEHIWSNNDFNSQAGTEQGIISCDIYNMGAGGVMLNGGDRVNLVPAGNYVRNGHLHNCNRLDRSYKAPVTFDGVGNRLEHCRIHDAPNMAIYLMGNDQVIEYNEVFHSAREVNDMGVLYTGMDATQLGTKICYNAWHDNRSSIHGPHGNTILYFDSPGGHGATIEGNVFYRNDCRGFGHVFINEGGVCFEVHDNLFLDSSSKSIRVQNRPGRKHRGYRTKLLETIDLAQPPYSERYPCMIEYWRYDGTKNHISRNVAWRSGVFDVGRSTGEYNLQVSDDPGFADAARDDFRLREDAAIFDKVPGFQAPPVDRMGMYRDAWRKTIPLRPPKIDLRQASTVSITGWPDEPAQIRYTLDGSTPGAASPAAGEGPIELPNRDGYATVRACAYNAETGAVSPVTTRHLPTRRARTLDEVTTDGWLNGQHLARQHGLIIDDESRLGHCDNGDYAVFGPLDFGTEGYTAIEYVIGSDPKYAGRKATLRLDGRSGETLAVLNTKSTGSFHTFETRRVQIPALTGRHEIHVMFEGGSGICNLAGIRFLR